MMVLIKDSYHNDSNHGCLYYIDEEFDTEGNSEGLTATFMGNVVCHDLETYLNENQDVQVMDSWPEGVLMK